MQLRVVPDTSSLVRAALNADSAAGRLVALLLSDGTSGELVMTAALIAELTEVLGRTKFAGRLSSARRRGFVLRVQAAAELVEPTERVRDCRDPTDDMVLEAALAAVGGSSDVVVVSDDRDLLSLDPWRGIRILKPEAALSLFTAIEP